MMAEGERETLDLFAEWLNGWGALHEKHRAESPEWKDGYRQAMRDAYGFRDRITEMASRESATAWRAYTSTRVSPWCATRDEAWQWASEHGLGTGTRYEARPVEDAL